MNFIEKNKFEYLNKNKGKGGKNGSSIQSVVMGEVKPSYKLVCSIVVARLNAKRRARAFGLEVELTA